MLCSCYPQSSLCSRRVVCVCVCWCKRQSLETEEDPQVCLSHQILWLPAQSPQPLKWSINRAVNSLEWCVWVCVCVCSRDLCGSAGDTPLFTAHVTFLQSKRRISGLSPSSSLSLFPSPLHPHCLSRPPCCPPLPPLTLSPTVFPPLSTTLSPPTVFLSPHLLTHPLFPIFLVDSQCPSTSTAYCM